MYVVGKHKPDCTKRYDGYNLSWRVNRMNYIHVIKRVFRQGGGGNVGGFPHHQYPAWMTLTYHQNPERWKESGSLTDPMAMAMTESRNIYPYRGMEWKSWWHPSPVMGVEWKSQHPSPAIGVECQRLRRPSPAMGVECQRLRRPSPAMAVECQTM